jgi:hypothetical protein
MIPEKEISKLERELDNGNKEILRLMEAYKKIVLKDEKGCIIPSAWTKSAIIPDKILDIKSAIAEHPFRIIQIKKTVNGMAHKAFLKEKRVNKNAVLNLPYPEIRG